MGETPGLVQRGLAHATIRGRKEMVKRVTKPEPRSGWSRAALPLGLLLLTALSGGAVWLRLQYAIGRCVDAGGKWASADRRCTFVEPEESEPVLARPGTTLRSLR
jgi:hypothetical protein